MRCFVGSVIFTAGFIAAVLATAQDFQEPGSTATDKALIDIENRSEDAITADSILTHIEPWQQPW